MAVSEPLNMPWGKQMLDKEINKVCSGCAEGYEKK